MNSMGSRHRYLSSIGFWGCTNQLARTGSVSAFNSKSGITQKGLEVNIRATHAIGGYFNLYRLLTFFPLILAKWISLLLDHMWP